MKSKDITKDLLLEPGGRYLPSFSEKRSDGSASAHSSGMYVLVRSGMFELKGRGLYQVHERIAPHLDGRFSHEQLIAASGDQAPLVQTYLDRLCEIGAISEKGSRENIPATFPKQVAGTQRMKIGSSTIAVSLSGLADDAGCEVSVSFLTEDQLRECFLEKGFDRKTVNRVWIIGEEFDKSVKLTLARYSAASELPKRRSNGLSIYRWDGGSTSLICLACVESRSSEGFAVFEQLEYVATMQTKYWSLVVMTASFPSDEHGIVGVGIDAGRLKRALTVEYLGREALKAAAIKQKILAAWGSLSSKNNDRVNLTESEANCAVVSESKIDCNENLLARFVPYIDFSNGEHIDLLVVPPISARIAVLQRIIRMRRESLPAVIFEKYEPFIVVSTDGSVSARLGHEEAVFEALLRSLSDEIGWSGVNVFMNAPSVRSISTRRRMLIEALSKFPKVPTVKSGYLHCSGFRFYFSLLVED